HPCIDGRPDSVRPRAKGRHRRGTNRGRKGKKGRGRLNGLLKRLHSRLRLACSSRRSTPTNFPILAKSAADGKWGDAHSRGLTCLSQGAPFAPGGQAG